MCTFEVLGLSCETSTTTVQNSSNWATSFRKRSTLAKLRRRERRKNENCGEGRKERNFGRSGEGRVLGRGGGGGFKILHVLLPECPSHNTPQCGPSDDAPHSAVFLRDGCQSRAHQDIRDHSRDCRSCQAVYALINKSNVLESSNRIFKCS